mmetsp:Transcript_17035/g.29515  ORF Transcript_17035/g.29515 Transcript_17035/m.29515 type:complete len:690 (+) Transcript_17035:162-2231(+)
MSQPTKTATPKSNGVSPYASASLYVGDLSSDVTEGMLFEIFNAIGPVASIRVCRDAVTRRSLGYAYVNFHGVQDAERALDQMNNQTIKGKMCRVMWSQRDPSARKSGAGNIFIKNLDKSIDHKTLSDTFSVFGTILSCKVVTDDNGESKGYGFVHYDADESAAKAIAKVNGMMLAGKTVYVAPFVPKQARQQNSAGQPTFTNLYLKNLPESIEKEEDLKNLVKEFGETTSVWLATETLTRAALAQRKAEDAKRKAARAEAAVEKAEKKGEEGDDADAAKKAEEEEQDAAHAERDAEQAAKAAEAAKTAEEAEKEAKEVAAAPTGEEKIQISKGFGFVNFAKPEEAQACIKGLNGKELDNGKVLYVGRAQKKEERDAELRKELEKKKLERISKYEGVNLYVKNLEDTVDDDRLRDEFKQFGTITSCRVMRDNGVSRGFGFVCFATSEEATRAVTEMNGRMIGSKPIYVALAQRKEQRRQQLELQHQRRNNKPGLAQQAAPAAGMYAPGAPVFYAPPPGQAAPQQGFVYPQQMMPRGAMPRQAWGAQGQYGIPPNAYVVGAGGRGAQQQQVRRNNAPQQQRRNNNQQQANQRGAVDNNIAATMQQMAAAPLDPKRIAELPADQQKLVLGEKLYPLIHASQPDLAGKITGMLLDSYFSEEIIHLIETPDALALKIKEALAVLEQHAAKQAQQ